MGPHGTTHHQIGRPVLIRHHQVAAERRPRTEERRRRQDQLKRGLTPKGPLQKSMINRRFMIVPPALPNSGHAEQLGTSKMLSCLLLDMADMRVPLHSDSDRLNHWLDASSHRTRRLDTLSDDRSRTGRYIAPPVSIGGAARSFELAVLNGSSARAATQVYSELDRNWT